MPELAAYPRLNELLRKKQMTIPQLHREMQRQGYTVNVKTLYRLHKNEPVERLDMNAASAICKVLDLQLTDLIQIRSENNNLQQMPRAKQKRLHQFMERNTEGRLTSAERVEFETLVQEAESISLANAQLLARQKTRLSR